MWFWGFVWLDTRTSGCMIGENESARFWLSVMNDLKNRGVKNVYVFCVDGLAGFRAAINAAFLKAQIQKWAKNYPSCVRSWDGNWDMMSNQLRILFEGRETV